ncbi:MAG TPA: ribbon-helix-helix domain-containing protein [Thermoplasmata archaeon]|nr:ribbon-helix-helix domain-containing protein [Thermoplasmata archaeon]
MFDKPPRRDPEEPERSAGGRIGPEDERIALRCHRHELQLVDAFVASGEFRSRSQLMRAALREFLRARALTAVASAPSRPVRGLTEVPVRLRADEVETLRVYGELNGNGRDLADVLAELVRRGELEAKVFELVERSRTAVRNAEANRERLRELRGSSEELERKGVLGR